MMKHSPAVLLGIIVLFTLVPAAGLTADGDASHNAAPDSAPASSSDHPAIDELRAQREKAQAELDAVNNPKSFTAGAPPGTPQEELLERRTLFHHIVRSLDEQIDDTLRLEQARRHRNDLGEPSTVAGEHAPDETPPYSVFFADQLWDNAFSLRLTVEGLQSQLSLIELRADHARESLVAAEERLRQSAERLENAKGTPTEERQAWVHELEALRQRAAAALLQATQLSNKRIEEELSDARGRLESANRRLAAVEPEVEFTEADLSKVRTHLSEERQRLTDALDQTTADRLRQFNELRTMEGQLAARLSKGNAAGRQVSRNLRRLRAGVEVARVRTDNLSLRGDLVQLLLDVVEGERQLWESRFAIVHDREPGKIREAYDRFTPLFTNFQASRDYVRQQAGIVSGQIGELETRVKNAATPADRAHAQALLDVHRQREDIYNSALQRLDQTSRFLERWKSMFTEQQQELPWTARLEGWWQRVWTGTKATWGWEVFSAEDTIEVDGKKITGHRSVTVGKIVMALVILSIGYWLCLYLAGLVGRLAMTRLGVDPELANLLRQWSQALLLTILIVTSLLWVKIPLTIFAFLGGAFAIGIGFGAQNLLKNVISGILLLIERPLRVGDLIEVENVRGRVTTIGLRSSTVRDAKGVVTLIPNSSFLERHLTNWTYSSRIGRFSLRIGAPYGSATQMVMDLLVGLAASHPHVLKTPQPQVLLDEFGSQGRIFTLNYWLEIRLDVDPHEVASDLRFAIEKKFEEAGVKILPAA
ncbi:MAG TPA: mechanosensitive ion channel domain-containing protein [Nitrospira sp.]|nr:mechanosensitive ion channel domain-containing protein [Nitrospira sp.]